MKEWDIILITESRYVNIENPDEYESNILADDEVLIREIQKHGLKTKRVDWADPNFDWSSTEVAIFRTTWDYHEKFTKFSNWLNVLNFQCTIINPIELIRWNLDKIYLKELEEKGINVPSTIFISKDENASLEKLFEETGWNKAVLKPNISAAARHTYKIDKGDARRYEIIFQKLIKNEDMMFQEFMENVPEKGEVSLMVFDGKYTHAILKKAKSGDFRVQDDYGGTVHNYTADETEIEFAESVMKSCDPVPMYGRVDIIWDNDGKPAVSELEIIEPELWFRYYPPSGKVFIDAVVKNYFSPN